MDTNKPPRVFISYSWDDQAHIDWVRGLAERLRENGVDVRLDQWLVKAGESFTQFMEQEVELADYILAICTPAYAQKSFDRSGGVGYEQQIVSGQLVLGFPRARFIPVLRKGDATGDHRAIPTHFLGTRYIDFRDDNAYAESLEDVLRSLFEAPEFNPPPIGQRPDFATPEEKPQPSTELVHDGRRRLDAAMPAEAEVGQRIDLLVQVRFPDAPLLGKAEWPSRVVPGELEQESSNITLSFPKDRAGNYTSQFIEILVSAPDFEITGANRRKLEIFPDRESLICSFLLMPNREGYCRVNIEVYGLDNTYLGAALVETAIGETEEKEYNSATSLVLTVHVDSTAEESTAEDQPSAVDAPAPQSSKGPKPAPASREGNVTFGPPASYRKKTPSLIGRALVPFLVLIIAGVPLFFVFNKSVDTLPPGPTNIETLRNRSGRIASEAQTWLRTPAGQGGAVTPNGLPPDDFTGLALDTDALGFPRSATSNNTFCDADGCFTVEIIGGEFIITAYTDSSLNAQDHHLVCTTISGTTSMDITTVVDPESGACK